MLKIVIASSNTGKISDIQQMLSPYEIAFVPQTELGIQEVEETGTTFVENAIIKARHAAQINGVATISDDSGLSVEALGGAPGIYSARYSGKEATSQSNIEKLLAVLEGVPDGQRQASFHCVLVYMPSFDCPTPTICHGQWQGKVSRTIRGKQGFGYDSVFIPLGLDCSAAELSREEKNQLSHRAKALNQLIQRLDENKTILLKRKNT